MRNTQTLRSKIRKIIAEQTTARDMTSDDGAKFYQTKSRLLHTAANALEDAAEYEATAPGGDPDEIYEILEPLYALIDAVEMAGE